ncbi:LOW QUALITY PROTEIN: N-acetyllactosaminide beta-1,3-N-acetylglucosaminyltransferase 3 [Chlamydotis macqueenii]
MQYHHCRFFPALLGVPGKCGGSKGSSDVFLLLAIKSSPVNYERQEMIGKTWGQEGTFEGPLIRRVFQLWLEQREHGDVLQWKFKDTFFNLTLKHLAGGALPCFIFNGDDDIFVNTGNVIHFAMVSQRAKRRHLMVGQLFINTTPIRIQHSKYFAPTQLLASNRYPPYCGSGGMLMSGYTALIISQESQNIELFPINNVYLGMCPQKAGLRPTSHVGIRIVGVGAPANADPFDPCYYRELLLVHRFMPYETVVMWDTIHQPQLQCGKRVSISRRTREPGGGKRFPRIPGSCKGGSTGTPGLTPPPPTPPLQFRWEGRVASAMPSPGSHRGEC